MNSLKGQGIIGEVVIFGVSIMMALGMYFMFTAVEYSTEQSIDFSVSNNIEPAIDESHATALLQQNIDSHVGNDYNDLTAYELTSLYFSTDGDIIIDGEERDRGEVEEDLTEYYNERLEFLFGYGEGANYVLNVTHSEEHLEEEKWPYDDHDNWNPSTRDIQTSGDEPAELVLWVGRDGAAGGVS